MALVKINMRREITGFSNPLIKRVRSLREKKHRKREYKFIAEGLRILTEAREAGYIPEMIFLDQNQKEHPLATILCDTVESNGGDIIETNREIIAKITGKDNAQMAVGIFADIDISLNNINRNDADIWMAVQDMRDPGNLGTMMRTCDAVGGGGLFLIDDCTDPFSVETIRASMGAIFTQKIVKCSWDEFIAWKQSGPGQLIGTSLKSDNDYQAISYQTPAFVLTGNEAQGLPLDYEQCCDILVKMPMKGKADSLNAAISSAVMSYEVLNQIRKRY